jgi:hypothetical protein
MEKVGLVQVFSEYFGFPIPIFIPPTAPQSPSSIIWGLYNRPEAAAVPRDLVPPHKIKKNIYRLYYLPFSFSGYSWVRTLLNKSAALPHVDPLLDNDLEICHCTKYLLSNGSLNKHVSNAIGELSNYGRGNSAVEDRYQAAVL